MRNIFLYHAWVLLCCQFLSNPVKSQLPKLYLHPKTTNTGKQSAFVDSIHFTSLSGLDGTRPGIYNGIQITKDYFLLTDYSSKTLFIFTKEGQFVKRVNFKKLGNFNPQYQEYTNSIVFFGSNKNYTLTPKDRIQIVQDWKDPRNKKYFTKYSIDLNDSSFTLRKSTPDEYDVTGASHYYEDYFWKRQIATSSLYKDSVDYEIKIYQNNQLVKGFFPYNHINEPRFLYTEEYAGYHATDTPSISFITRPFCDTVYQMNKGNLLPAYQLVLPLENTPPATLFTRPFKSKTERENFNRNNTWMLRQVNSFYETQSLIYLSLSFLGNFDTYIYHKPTNKVYKTKSIKADDSQYNLPLLAEIRGRRGDTFYKLQKAGDLLAFFNQRKDVPIPKELETFFSSNPDSDSLLIVAFKLKN